MNPLINYGVERIYTKGIMEINYRETSFFPCRMKSSRQRARKEGGRDRPASTTHTHTVPHTGGGGGGGADNFESVQLIVLSQIVMCHIRMW